MSIQHSQAGGVIANLHLITTEYLLTGNGPQKRGAVSDSDAISEDDIKAAFFEGADDLTKEEMDALWADARDYMRYKLEQRRKQQQ